MVTASLDNERIKMNAWCIAGIALYLSPIVLMLVFFLWLYIAARRADEAMERMRDD
jgi:hypothetical protein